MASQTSTKLTYEDFAAIPDDGLRHEIIDGEHYVSPSPNLRHQLISIRLSSALFSFVSERKLGHVYAAPLDTLLSQHDIVNPDIIFVSNANAHVLTAPNIKGVPDLLIEILSSNRDYDRKKKYRLYERVGVQDYWIVDPFEDAVDVYRRQNDRFVRVDPADTLTTPLLPGFTLPLRDLFA